MFKYSAYVINNDGQHVIANAQTERGLLSALKRYASTNRLNVQYAPDKVVYMWHMDEHVYDKRLFSSFS